ncbi:MULTISPECIES: pyridoxal 5'-phosphate synthase glutaminase subunit PdxT [Halolamina]|uniref:Pyridoxal 5'-phosphate synthase subunit PdxT n=1 Tax=Halolamina pelagica TaxID=699431 RepID=A0A1I5TYD2_9EURY|nr:MULTISPECIES: pyridoxal 5'-phosphate synthase glutaminase subunit PdxT [Halolamina]NHX36698.1 pyridoxal 5'-phosphate synthase glutaminase subunit PdxT [Halolamina sp. R1-12]SFP87931.1 5'-phosphate synthase pdxT subunit [Halolamina pelagica]
MQAGVIAVQGDVSEHAAAIERAAAAHGEAAEVVEIRQSGTVPDCDVLLMPGGESTAISRLLAREGIDDEIRDHVAAGKPVLATCAGLIVAATDAKDERVDTLDLIDVTVDRNAFGRQKDSFEAPLAVKGLESPFPAVFIRAPLIDEVGDGSGVPINGGDGGRQRTADPDGDAVEVLARWDGDPVAVRQGPVVGTSFHPELTSDSRIHDLAFFDTVEVSGQ